MEKSRMCTVYFISTHDVPDYPIKIGITFGSVGKRLAALQTACPHRLSVLAAFPAPRKFEWFLHLDLRPHRMNGEWFRRSPEVLAAVEEAIKNNHPARRSKGKIR